MCLKPSLLSRMRDPEPPDPESMHPTSKTLLQRITQDHDPQILNLLDRMSSPTLSQDLLPLQMQDSIKTSSLSAMHLSKNIERGRYQNPPYMSKHQEKVFWFVAPCLGISRGQAKPRGSRV